MIAIVEGTLGAGKTYYALRLIDDALGRGLPVATNVDLGPDALLRAAKAHPLRRLSAAACRRRAVSLSAGVLVSEDLDQLMDVRLHGKGESRGLMVLDEAHNWMNARTWNNGQRERLVRFFSQSRKLGWDIYIISQRAEMIDKQVRNLAEYQVSLKNLRRFRKFGLGLPFNLFVAVWRWNVHADRTIIKRDSYTLNRRVAGMYDTFATSHGLGHDVGTDGAAIWLPREPSAQPETLPTNGNGPVGAGPLLAIEASSPLDAERAPA